MNTTGPKQGLTQAERGTSADVSVPVLGRHLLFYQLREAVFRKGAAKRVEPASSVETVDVSDAGTDEVTKAPHAGVIVYGVVLFGVIAWSYAGSLSHMHRADQWWFLLDTMDCEGFWETFLHSYSSGRTLEVVTPEPFLFRPVLFALLSAQKSLFQNEIALYQVTGIVLHYGVCLLLFALMRQAARANAGASTAIGALSYLLPIYFGVNVKIIEAVIWSHLNGYLLFYALTLGALLSVSGGDAPDKRRLGVAWGLMLVASFTFEYGQFYAPLLGVLAAARMPPGKGIQRRVAVVALFLLITVAFRASDGIDRKAHAASVSAGAEAGLPLHRLGEIAEPATWKNTFYFMKHNTVSPFFPFAIDTNLLNHGRLLVTQVSFKELVAGGVWGVTALAFFFAWGATLLYCGVRARVGRQWRELVFPAVVVAFLGLYTGGAVFLRMNTVGPDYVEAYNAYWPFLLVLLLGFVFLCLGARGKGRYFAGGLWVFVVWLGVTAALSASKLREENAEIARHFEPELRIIDQMEAFIGAHEHEASFSFAFDLTRSDPLPMPLMRGVPITTTLFRRHEDPGDPAYVLAYRDGELSFVTGRAYREGHPGAGAELFPRLVKPGNPYNVYWYGEMYWGVPRWEGPYDPGASQEGVVGAATLAELGSRIREAAQPSADEP